MNIVDPARNRVAPGAQQMPRLPISRILRLRRLWIHRDPRLPQYHFRGNDVPRVVPNNVRRQEIERARRIRLVVASAHAARITSLLQLEDGGLHLHRHKMPRPSHHKIITPRISPGPAHRQVMVGRPHHEVHLRPFPAQFLVTDLMFPLFHSPTSEQRKRHSWKNSRMPPYVFIEAGKKEESKVIPPKICDDFHKWNRPAARTCPVLPKP